MKIAPNTIQSQINHIQSRGFSVGYDGNMIIIICTSKGTKNVMNLYLRSLT